METECHPAKNTTFAENGWDIPVFGVGHSCFYAIHVTAMCCLILSLISAIAVIFALLKSKNKTSFMKWPKHERFLVYGCICNSVYCGIHMLDHIQILIAQDHVRPPGLCNVYTTILINACMCESSFSLAFLSIAFRTNVDFGQRDWKLLVNVCVIGPFFSRLNGFTHGCLGPTGFL
jgi:hypothetical protein